MSAMSPTCIHILYRNEYTYLIKSRMFKINLVIDKLYTYFDS